MIKFVHMVIVILSVLTCVFCIQAIITAMFPRYTVLYQMNEYGNSVPIGVQDNKTRYVYRPTPSNIALAKGDKIQVSPLCKINDKRLLVCKYD